MWKERNDATKVQGKKNNFERLVLGISQEVPGYKAYMEDDGKTV